MQDSKWRKSRPIGGNFVQMAASGLETLSLCVVYTDDGFEPDAGTSTTNRAHDATEGRGSGHCSKFTSWLHLGKLEIMAQRSQSCRLIHCPLLPKVPRLWCSPAQSKAADIFGGRWTPYCSSYARLVERYVFQLLVRMERTVLLPTHCGICTHSKCERIGMSSSGAGQLLFPGRSGTCWIGTIDF